MTIYGVDYNRKRGIMYLPVPNDTELSDAEFYSSYMQQQELSASAEHQWYIEIYIRQSDIMQLYVDRQALERKWNKILTEDYLPF